MENSDIKLFVCGDVKAPQRAKGDAGIDFFVPNFSEQFLKDLTDKNPGAPMKYQKKNLKMSQIKQDLLYFQLMKIYLFQHM